MNRRHWCMLFNVWLTLSLAACRASPTPTPEPTPTATLAPTNTAIVFPPTWTPEAEPTLTPTRAPSATPKLTATLSLSPTETANATPTETATASPTAEIALTDKAEFVADVTVPDGSPFRADAAFTKTWRVKNVGTAAWTTGYTLVFVSGEQMGGPAEVALPAEIKPDETVDISVALTAPQRLAFYTGFWQLRNADGELFGVGVGANEPLYVQIQVTGGGGDTTPAPTAPAGTLRVTATTLSVLTQTVTIACPYTFIFNGTFTSEGAGTATYQLETTSDIPGFVFDLPAPFDSRFTDAGPRTLAFAYTLEFRNSVSGQMWVHILSPDDLESSRLSFSLTCQ